MNQVQTSERASLRERLWNPYVLVFLTSGSIMTIELVASRLLAPRIGVSLYTWASVIAVMLAGISIGNYLGGRLADRRPSRATLGVILALAGLATLAPLWLGEDLANLAFPFKVSLVVWLVVYIGAVFMGPCIVLGCVSPIVAKLSVTDLKRSGSTVGRIYAAATMGSLVGTFATGYFLIGQFGTKSTLLGVAGLLLVLGLWFLSEAPWRTAVARVAVLVLVCGAAVLGLQRADLIASDCMLETNYFCIVVSEEERNGRTIRELTLDRLVHSYTDMNDPTHLEYGYERIYAGLIEPVTARKPDLATFFIGGGGYTFPRYMEILWPESRVVVAEIDPGVTQAAHYWLNLDRDTRIETFNMDARNYLELESAPEAFDVVFGDAFNDFSVPFHLTTLEFDRLVDRSLRDGGLYLVNIIDAGEHGHFFRAYVRTLQQVFPHVVVIPSAATWRISQRTTFVIAASHEPIDLSAVPDDYAALPAAELAEYMDNEAVRLLSDNYVPVGNLMAPIAEEAFSAGLDTPSLLDLVPGGAPTLVAAGLSVAVFGLLVMGLRRRRRTASEWVS